MRNNFLKCTFATALSLVVICSYSIAQSGYGGGAPSKPAQKSKAKAGTSAAKKGTSSKGKGAASSGYGSTPAAQNGGYGSTPATDNSAAGGYGSPATSTGGYGSPAGSGVASSVRPSNLPIVFKQNSGGGIGDSVRQSLRVDNAIDKQLIKERRPLEYERIREDDAVYSQRIWMEIDTREKMNQSFGYSADMDNGNQRFISILYNAIQSDSVVAFSAAEDDRFTTPLTKKQMKDIMFGGNDTTEQFDLKGNVVSLEVRPKQINPDSIYRFRVKEDIVFDKKNSRMFKRILGIAPVMNHISSSGINQGPQILFWVYYPDIRNTLSKYEVYNPKNHNSRMTWEDLFEFHMFSYYILKSTMNNAKDRTFEQYINDPLFRLLEGEKVKEKIFNYESDLWSL